MTVEVPLQGPCTRCQAWGIRQATWRSYTRSERRTLTAKGVRRWHARGLCATCYESERAAGMLGSHERMDWMVEDYVLIRGDLVEGTAWRRVDAAAARIGVPADALRGALSKWGVAA